MKKINIALLLFLFAFLSCQIIPQQKKQESITHVTHVAFFGRSLDTYRKMFGLTDDDLSKKILDCPGGPSSFLAELKQIPNTNLDSRSVDIQYGKLADELEHLANSGMRMAFKKYYDGELSGAGLERMKLMVANFDNIHARFLKDYKIGKNTYLHGDIIDLNTIADNTYELTLSANLLFLYAHLPKLDYEFHLNAILELLRVTTIGGSVHLYPLDNFKGNDYPLLAKLVTELQSMGHFVKIVPVQQSSVGRILGRKMQGKPSEMLVITKSL